jgi:hypothetical protein
VESTYIIAKRASMQPNVQPLLDRLGWPSGVRRSFLRFQLAHVPEHLEGLLAINIGRQAGCDLASEVTQAYEALQFGVVSHGHPPVARFGESGPREVSFYGGQWGVRKY